MSSRSGAACAALLALACAGRPRCALADPIIYTEQAIATGTLGATDFIDGLVTITLAADTGGVSETPSGFATNTGQASLTLGGVSEGLFLDPLTAFASAGAAGTTLGITDEQAFADVLDTSLPAGLSYDLSGSLAPQTGASLISPNAAFATTNGELNLFLAGDSRFSATVQSVPEPATLALFTGAAALLILLRAAARKTAY
jgi:hypothetical protein